jgi:hypothetical protein
MTFPVYTHPLTDDLTLWAGVNPVDRKEWAAGLEWRF